MAETRLSARIVPTLALGAGLFAATPAAAAPAALFTLEPALDRASPASVEEYYVELEGGAAALADAQQLDLWLPGGLQMARVDKILPQPHGHYWQGRILDTWQVLLTSYDGAISGLVYTPTSTFELLSGPDGRLRVAELDPAAYPPCGTDAGDHVHAPLDLGLPAPAAAGNAPSAADGVPVMDALVVYTAQARNSAGGESQMRATIQSAVNITNTAYTNAEVQAELFLLHMAEVSYADSGDSSTDLRAARDEPEIRALRDRWGADLVSLIVGNTNACGRGYVQRTPRPSFERSAVQVTQRSCMVGNLSFAHEFGHNQGCEHDPANGTSPSNAAFPYAYGHFHSGAYRTVMSYSSECQGGCRRAPYFSNSNVDHQGLATGVLDERENYRTITQTAPIIVDFRPTHAFLSFDVGTARIDENAGAVSLQVNRTRTSSGAVDLNFEVRDGTAVVGQDVAIATGTVSWADGDDTPKTLSVPILDDSVVEGSETFTVVLTEATLGVPVGTVTATVTIDDIEEGTFEMQSATREVREGVTEITLTVLRTEGAEGTVTVNYLAVDGTATAGADFAPLAGTLSWLDGDTSSREIVVGLVDDRVVEGDEAFEVQLTTPTGGAVVGAQDRTEVRIVDREEGRFVVTTSTVTVTEDAGEVAFAVARREGSDGEVSVRVATVADTATVGEDYAAFEAVFTFADGDTTPQVVTIPILDDDRIEGDERFTVQLSAPTGNAILGAPDRATIRIQDWETGEVAFATTTTTVSEAAGSVSVEVLRRAGASGPASVRYTVLGGSATLGVDVEAVTGTVTWSDGDDAPRTVVVPLLDDREIEEVESFQVRLSDPAGAAQGLPLSTAVRIQDREEGRLAFTEPSYTADETAGTFVVEVTRLDGAAGAVSAQYSLRSGTAEVGADVEVAEGRVRFGDGETGTQRIELEILDDDETEAEEAFELVLSDAEGNVALPDPVEVRIADVGGGAIAVEPGTITIPEAGETVRVTLTRVGEASGAVEVGYRAVAGSATAGTDFAPTEGVVTWADGETGARTVEVDLVDDAVEEDDETFTIVFSTSREDVPLRRTEVEVRLTSEDGGSGEELDPGGCVSVAGSDAGAGLLVWIGLLVVVRRRRRGGG